MFFPNFTTGKMQYLKQ